VVRITYWLQEAGQKYVAGCGVKIQRFHSLLLSLFLSLAVFCLNSWFYFEICESSNDRRQAFCSSLGVMPSWTSGRGGARSAPWSWAGNRCHNVCLPPATERLVERYEIDRYYCRAVGERKLGLLQIPLSIEHIEKVGDPACVARA
jgi:hypothetical protein